MEENSTIFPPPRSRLGDPEFCCLSFRQQNSRSYIIKDKVWGSVVFWLKLISDQNFLSIGRNILSPAIPHDFETKKPSSTEASTKSREITPTRTFDRETEQVYKLLWHYDFSDPDTKRFPSTEIFYNRNYLGDPISRPRPLGEWDRKFTWGYLDGKDDCGKPDAGSMG